MDHHVFVNTAIFISVAALLLYIAGITTGKKALNTAGDAAFFLVFAAAAGASLIIGINSGRAPMANTYETMIIMAATLPVIYVIFTGYDSRRMIAAGLAIAALLILSASSFFDTAPRPLVPALKSNWLAVHVMLTFVSYAAFTVACIASVIYLASKNRDESKADDAAYRSILFGYPFLTLGIVTGAVWADQAWGSYWSWDPKETWALITWLIYGAYLHLRLTLGIKGVKSSMLAIAGFILVLFTYFGVNYLLTGLHSYK